MFSTEDQEAILRYVFSHEANMELALGVIHARKAISERIIKDFLTRLEAKLVLEVRQLGGSWNVVNDLKKDPFQPYKQIYITKGDWEDLYRISLAPDKFGGKGFFLGVWNDWDRLGQQRLDGGRISEVLEGHVKSGKISNEWPFWMWAAPYTDWVDEKTLTRFLGDKCDRSVSELADLMLNIAKTTETLIDKLVHDWPKKQPGE